jgi:hypothetical protein
MRKMCALAAMVAVTGVMTVGVGSASAQPLPPQLTSILNQLPPQVSGPLTDAIETALAQSANVPGINQSASAPGNSSAAAVDVPGLATVNKSETTKSSAKVTRLALLGQNLIVKESNSTGGTNTGTLGAVGDLVDQLNAALCPSTPSHDNPCLTVLYANATTLNTPGGAASDNTAYSNVANLSGNTASISVLPNIAETVRANIGGSDRCTDVASSALLGGARATALLGLVGLNFKNGAIVAPC